MSSRPLGVAFLFVSLALLGLFSCRAVSAQAVPGLGPLSVGGGLLLVGVAVFVRTRPQPRPVTVTPMAPPRPRLPEKWRLRDPDVLPACFSVAAPKLLPRLRNRAWLALDALEREVRGDLGCRVPFVELGEDLVAEIVHCDGPGATAIDDDRLRTWHVSFESALGVALDNLRSLGSGRFVAPADGEPGAWAAGWADQHDASRLLLPELLRGLPFEGTPVAVVPTDEAFIVADLGRPRGLQAAVRLAEAALRSRTAIPISGNFLILKEGSWVPWEGDRYAVNPDVAKRLRQAVLLRLYSRQKVLLEQRNEIHAQGMDIPEVEEVRFPEGNRLQCTWREGLPVALPAVEAVTLVRRDGTRLGDVPWERLSRLLGPRFQPLGLHPERHVLQAFPTEADLMVLRPV